MPSLKELDDERIYHDGLEIKRLHEELEKANRTIDNLFERLNTEVAHHEQRLHEELANANKTIDHLTRAHKVLIERIDQLLAILRRLRAVTIDPTVQLEIDKVLRAWAGLL